MSEKVAAEELKALQHLYDIATNPTFQLISMQTPESARDGYNAKMQELSKKYNFDIYHTIIDLQTGEFKRASKIE